MPHCGRVFRGFSIHQSYQRNSYWRKPMNRAPGELSLASTLRARMTGTSTLWPLAAAGLFVLATAAFAAPQSMPLPAARPAAARAALAQADTGKTDKDKAAAKKKADAKAKADKSKTEKPKTEKPKAVETKKPAP